MKRSASDKTKTDSARKFPADNDSVRVLESVDDLLVRRVDPKTLLALPSDDSDKTD